MNCLMQFIDITECLQNQEINPALKQGSNLLTENISRLLKRHLAQRLNANPQRPNGPRDPSVKALRCFFRQPRTVKINVMDLVTQPVPLQSNRIPSESVGFNHLRPGLQILMMNPANQVRLRN